MCYGRRSLVIYKQLIYKLTYLRISPRKCKIKFKFSRVITPLHLLHLLCLTYDHSETKIQEFSSGKVSFLLPPLSPSRALIQFRRKDVFDRVFPDFSSQFLLVSLSVVFVVQLIYCCLVKRLIEWSCVWC